MQARAASSFRATTNGNTNNWCATLLAHFQLIYCINASRQVDADFIAAHYYNYKLL